MTDTHDLASIVRGKASEVLGVPVEEITEDTDLAQDHGVDSLELLEIAARVEKQLGVRIKVADLAEAKTVGHAIELLGARLAEHRDEG